jgi:hypothetical protein
MRLYLSYRPNGSLGWPERVAGVPGKRFGAANVLESARHGTVTARDEIVGRVAQCDAMVAIIGPGWASNANGSTIDDPTDPVRLELAAAFAHGLVSMSMASLTDMAASLL